MDSLSMEGVWVWHILVLITILYFPQEASILNTLQQDPPLVLVRGTTEVNRTNFML